jgi:hypothetical protein
MTIRPLLLASLLALPAATGHAALKQWSGQGDGTSWNDASNWTPVGSPQTGDDVAISSSVVIVANSAAGVAVQSLTLGDGVSSTTLRTSTGIIVSGHLVVKSSSVLQFDGTEHVVASSATLEAGALATHFGPVNASTVSAVFRVGAFDLQAGATISATGLGMRGGLAVAPGSGNGGGGAGSGGSGAGGAGHASGGGRGGVILNGGSAYGDPQNGFDLGSGGGGSLAPCFGGNGGGRVQLITERATINGRIEAHGAAGGSGCAFGGGGGSGGTIRIQTADLLGSGTVSVDGGSGGASGTGGGGGSAGRIMIYSTGTLSSTIAISSAPGLGGTGGPSGDPGGGGSTFVTPKVFTGAGAAFCTDAGNWWANLEPQPGEYVVFGATAPTKNCTWAFGSVIVGSMTILPEYQATVQWASFSSEISGSFAVGGGSFTMSNVILNVGGDLTHTGGLFQLANGTVTLSGASSQTVRVTDQTSFNHLRFEGGREVLLASSLDVNGNWRALGPSTVTLTGLTTAYFSGDVDFDDSVVVMDSSSHVFQLDGSGGQLIRSKRMGQLRLAGGGSGTIPSGYTMELSSGVTIAAGALLTAQNAVLASSGDWVNAGTFDGTGGTVAFGAAGATQTIVSGANGFYNLCVDNLPAVVRFSTDVIVANNVKVIEGILDLGASTHRVRGNWFETSSGTVRGAASVVVFDGSGFAQSVTQSTGSAFHSVVSSNTTVMTFTTHTILSGELSMQEGVAAFPGIELRLGGDLLRRGGHQPAVAGSTVTLDGVGRQSIDLSTGSISLDSLVVANSSSGVSIDESLTIERNLTISTGAVLWGSSGTLRLRGDGGRWDSYGAVYRSSGPTAHRVEWAPPAGGSLFVAAGSTVGASIDVRGEVSLAGDLFLDGTSEFLIVHPDAVLDARSSTITLGGTTDLRLSTASLYRRDANSWLVFAGSGTDRGLTMSTGPIGNLRIAPDDPAAGFRFHDLSLDGTFVHERGGFSNSTGAVFSVAGDFVIESPGFDFVSRGSSTVRMTGTALQTVTVASTTLFYDFEIASSSPVVLSTGGALMVGNDLLLSSGTLRGSDAAISLSGDWTGTGGLFVGETSTVTLANPATTQTFVDASTQNFHALVLSSGTRVFKRGYSADLFTALTPGTTIEFANAETFSISTFVVNGNSLAAPIVLRSTAPGLAALFSVSDATVTATRIRDIDATGGTIINVNDGRSINDGNTPGWNFTSDLVMIAPGETFIEATGKTGTPTPQVAGTTFTVTVLAVSDRFVSVPASSITVHVVTSDAFDVEPSSRALINGSTTFPIVLRTAEPAPLNSVLTPVSPDAVGQTGSTLAVNPNLFSRLQLIFEGQSELPGSDLGIVGTPGIQISGRPFDVTVRGTDAYWNLVSTTGAQVGLSSTTAPVATLPPPVRLIGGTSNFSNVVVTSTGIFTLSSSHTADASILPVVSSTFPVFSLSNSSPAVGFDIPNNAVVGTLSGSITGSAQDSVSVAVVRVAIQDKTAQRYYDWDAGTFTASAPVFRDADVEPFRGTDVVWKIALDDGKLSEGRKYFALARSTNPTQLVGQAESTFTFRSADLLFSPGDGEGTASLASDSLPGCGVVVSTLTFTVGDSGIGLGGAVAVRVPEGWTKPVGLSPTPSPAVGYAAVTSTSLAWAVPPSSPVVFNPVAIGSTTLGDRWISVEVPTTSANAFAPGEDIVFTIAARAPADASGSGPQYFDVRSRKDRFGELVGISTTPVVTLTTGPAAGIAFSDEREITIGPLQQVPTGQILLTDACGNEVPAPVPTNVYLTAEASSGTLRDRDLTAEFIQSDGPSTPFVTIQGGLSRSNPFFFQTSTTGVSVEVLRATATVSGNFLETERVVRLATATVALSAVSIDTGTLAAGATSVSLTPGLGQRAIVRFSLPAGPIDWDVSVGTAPAMDDTLLREGGVSEGSESIAVPFDPVACGAYTCGFLDPGRYFVRIRAGAGLLEDRTVEIRVLDSPFLFGNLGASGAGALVRADGPGTGAGHYDRATSTGYFRIRGLRAGSAYGVSASTLSLVEGAAVELSTAVGGVFAAAGGTDVGTIGFGGLGTVRVSVGIPVPAPTELFGGVTFENADGSQRAFGTLHYPKGAASSDDGGQILGRDASTWTILGLNPGVYTATVELAALGISSTLPNLIVSTGISNFPLVLRPRANLYGRVVLPSTQTFGSFIAVQAISTGAAVPSVFGGTFVPPASGGVVPSSAAYSLFGLTPGSWTIRAEARGFKSTSAFLYVPDSNDIGDALTGAGGLDLTLDLGAVLVGSVTVFGDTARFDGSGETDIPGLGLSAPAGRYFVFVDAYNPATFARTGTVVEITTHPIIYRSTFEITGLDPGEHWVTARLSGFRKDPSGPIRVGVSSSTLARADFDFREIESRARFTVWIATPASPCSCASDYNRIGAVFEDPFGKVRAVSDVTALDGVDGASIAYFPSSFTLLTAPLADGFHRVRFRHGATGARAESTVAVALGSTGTAHVPLDRATYTVSGTASFSGTARFSGDGFSVSASSVPGLIAYSSSSAYCLLGTTEPVTLPALRVELLPLERGSSLEPVSVFASTSPNCADFSLPASSAALASGLLAYATGISADGSFSIPDVPPGIYRLRVPGDLDGDASNGDEIAPVRGEVRVTTGAAVTLRLKGGVRVSGVLRSPEGVTVDRAMRVNLSDADGTSVASSLVRFNAERSRSFAFDSVADGDYVVSVEDLGLRATLAAEPERVTVAGGAVSGIELLLVAAGNIVGRIAVEQKRPDGTSSFVTVTNDNRELLPPGLRVVAAANPWRFGGFGAALGEGCGADGCATLTLDSNSQFIVPALLPGVYDLEFNVENDPSNSTVGALDLVSTVRGGVAIESNRTTDVGIVRLFAGATLTGSVVDASSGAAVANLPVRAVPSLRTPGSSSRRRPAVETETDDLGRYELRGLDPAVRYYDVSAAPRSDDATASRSRPYLSAIEPSVDVLSTATVDFSLIPAALSIFGTVAGEDGATLQSAGERFAEPGALLVLRRDAQIETVYSAADLRFRTQPDGAFSIPHLGTGTYRLRVFADGYTARTLAVTLSSASLDLGTITLPIGASISGAIRTADGLFPGEDEIESVFAAAPDMSASIFGSLTRDPTTRTITGYRVSGLSPGTGYRILLRSSADDVSSPDAGRYVVASSSGEATTLDLVYLRPRPAVIGKARRSATTFELTFETNQPLRARTRNDENPAAIVSTLTAQGTLSNLAIASDRRRITGVYTPGVSESSFTLLFNAYSALRDPESANVLNPEFLLTSTFTFYPGLDDYHQASIPNLTGGEVALELDPGRVTLPEGAFFVDASSTVRVAFERSDELLQEASGLQAAGYTPAAANLRALRYPADRYPEGILRAMAATPPTVVPRSSFYDVLLPAGVPTTLRKPAELTLRYSTGTDVSALAVYWYNAAANTYVRQDDVSGAAPRIDGSDRTITIKIDHFSTYVVFDSGVAAISGSQFSGGEIEAFNFPNPFDLNDKTVTPIHGVPARAVRGTLIRFALPPDLSGSASVRIFTIAGRRVRTIDMGSLAGGKYYYQAWDGRNDAGEDVASGVYIGQVKVGGKSAFFKMAVVK